MVYYTQDLNLSTISMTLGFIFSTPNFTHFSQLQAPGTCSKDLVTKPQDLDLKNMCQCQSMKKEHGLWEQTPFCSSPQDTKFASELSTLPAPSVAPWAHGKNVQPVFKLTQREKLYPHQNPDGRIWS